MDSTLTKELANRGGLRCRETMAAPSTVQRLLAEEDRLLSRKMSIIATNVIFKQERGQKTGANASGEVIMYRTYPNRN